VEAFWLYRTGENSRACDGLDEPLDARPLGFDDAGQSELVRTNPQFPRRTDTGLLQPDLERVTVKGRQEQLCHGKANQITRATGNENASGLVRALKACSINRSQRGGVAGCVFDVPRTNSSGIASRRCSIEYFRIQDKNDACVLTLEQLEINSCHSKFTNQKPTAVAYSFNSPNSAGPELRSNL
jgi:hypothetical protein